MPHEKFLFFHFLVISFFHLRFRFLGSCPLLNTLWLCYWFFLRVNFLFIFLESLTWNYRIIFHFLSHTWSSIFSILNLPFGCAKIEISRLHSCWNSWIASDSIPPTKLYAHIYNIRKLWLLFFNFLSLFNLIMSRWTAIYTMWVANLINHNTTCIICSNQTATLQNVILIFVVSRLELFVWRKTKKKIFLFSLSIFFAHWTDCRRSRSSSIPPHSKIVVLPSLLHCEMKKLEEKKKSYTRALSLRLAVCSLLLRLHY